MHKTLTTRSFQTNNQFLVTRLMASGFCFTAAWLLPRSLHKIIVLLYFAFMLMPEWCNAFKSSHYAFSMLL